MRQNMLACTYALCPMQKQCAKHLTWFGERRGTDGTVCKIALVVGFRWAVQGLAGAALRVEAGTSNRAECLGPVTVAVTSDEGLAVVRGDDLGFGRLASANTAPARAVVG